MARKHQAESLLKDGLCPSEIAAAMGISVKSVLQYLQARVGEGAIRLSDVYFSWSPEKRALLQRGRRGKSANLALLAANGLSREELEVFESLRRGRAFSGDMYDYISDAEVVVHDLVRTILQRHLGSDEGGWWRRGIPNTVRLKCVQRREEDEEPSPSPYAYTSLIDLWAVISKNWAVCKPFMPPAYSVNRKQLEEDLVRLNRLRNAVMHPVKSRKWTEADFEFVREIAAKFKVAEASAHVGGDGRSSSGVSE